ncbi:SHOCT domain-containing protein [Fodinibius sediminis]|uniref:Putative membrane protein n=1 Tax=Fodinibius sediminis TaxID=1214077 RepID=A0A521F0F6_9BACT|nr:SHOCT domain-containing protein [Fodinibius sediminis]SMO89668.1 putative membrane protein [Fodinibius sediminis]
MFYEHHFIGLHWLWWIVIVGTILLLVFDIIPYRPREELEKDAMEILKRRYARGEIEREEFEERKQILKQHD